MDRTKRQKLQPSMDHAGATGNLREFRERFSDNSAQMGDGLAEWARQSRTHLGMVAEAFESMTRNAQRGYGPLGETLRQFNANLKQTADFARTAAPAFTQLDLRLMQVRQAMEMSGVSLMKFSNAMGTNIAQAVVYGNSIGAAMEKALKATLASISAQALVRALYETAVGFAELFWNPPAATAAFESAALFYAVAGAAGAAGAAIAGGGSRGGSASAMGHRRYDEGSGGDGRGTYPGGGFAPGLAPGSQAPGLTVNLHIDGRQFATAAVPSISDAVRSGAVTLHATTSERGAPVGH